MTYRARVLHHTIELFVIQGYTVQGDLLSRYGRCMDIDTSAAVVLDSVSAVVYNSPARPDGIRQPGEA